MTIAFDARRVYTSDTQTFSLSSCSSCLRSFARFWAWTTQKRPSWKEDKVEAAVAIVVFGVTGSTSVAVVRPALKSTIGLEGSMIEGPNSYRVLSLVLVSPIYACFLLTFGTLAGRHTFFAGMGMRIIGRFIPASVRQRVQDAICRATKA